MKKDEARRRVRAQKNLMTATECRQAAIDVFAQVEQLAAFMMAKHILMYHSLPDELSTLEFIDKWHKRKKFFLPRVNGVNLDILPYEKTELRLGAFQIEEPTGDNMTSIDDIDMVIVPGIAYDKHGNRVGRGKGYYDRLLSECQALKVGVGYDCQLVDDIETEAFDMPVDLVITQSRMYRRKKSSK